MAMPGSDNAADSLEGPEERFNPPLPEGCARARQQFLGDDRAEVNAGSILSVKFANEGQRGSALNEIE
jgi:hypothetical protein